jgi:PKD repeat protein
VPGEACTQDSAGAPAGSLVTGISFYPASGGSFPAAYRGALFFSDRLRDCIYALLPGADGLPQRGKVVLFAAGAMRPMDIEVAPGGDLLYVDQEHYQVQRISFTAEPSNQTPTAVATASPSSGVAPLSVIFDATGSSDPDGDALTYEWDLDGDGQFDDSTGAQASFTYTASGSYTATLRVSDGRGGVNTTTVGISARDEVTTLQFTPDADARVEQARFGTNFGSSTFLQVRGGTNLVAESYVRFRVSGVTGTIQSAKLGLRALNNGTVDGPALFTASSTWSQSTITWLNRPARDTAVIGDVGAIASNANVEYDVKPVVTGDGIVTFALIGTSGDGVDFASRESSDATKRPRLIVTFAG